MSNSESSFFSEETVNKVGKIAILIATIIFLTIEIVALSPGSFTTESFKEGEVAKHTVRAPRDSVLEDPLNTEKLRARARAAVPRVFSFKAVTQNEIYSEIDQMFAT